MSNIDLLRAISAAVVGPKASVAELEKASSLDYSAGQALAKPDQTCGAMSGSDLIEDAIKRARNAWWSQ